MRHEAAAERIRAFVLQQFPLARQRRIRDDDPLLSNGIIDSLGILDLVAFLESEFSMTVSDEDLSPESFQSIESIAAFVARKLGGDSARAGEGPAWTS